MVTEASNQYGQSAGKALRRKGEAPTKGRRESPLSAEMGPRLKSKWVRETYRAADHGPRVEAFV